ncbi:hypothetical protein GCM10009678_02400 [Actinomadura kijaniata]|uniref:Uncharacterized protein n=1 Tax=Actinomadura namibiensis TaxID=182080 RepID=A0A7W3LTT6_ACTNM|nr:hypothetical protein [Actinomadura namibiensis]MBA8954188.1 hypothetical protein [Actinomadura namibiensis]
MRTRSLALAVPALLLAVGACDEKTAPPPPSPPAAASTPATTEPATATPTTGSPTAGKPSATPTKPRTRPAKPSRKPVLSGPRTGCGEVQPPNGDILAVAVYKGRAECATALRVFRTYYRRDTPKQGSGGLATVEGWTCVSNTAAAATSSGRVSSCRKAGVTIVADVIP